MKGQARALIPALVGIVPLLLAGITGFVSSSGEQQINTIAETTAVTAEQHVRNELADSVRAGADVAAVKLGNDIVADLTVELTHTPSFLIASSEADAKERG